MLQFLASLLLFGRGKKKSFRIPGLVIFVLLQGIVLVSAATVTEAPRAQNVSVDHMLVHFVCAYYK